MRACMRACVCVSVCGLLKVISELVVCIVFIVVIENDFNLYLSFVFHNDWLKNHCSLSFKM